MQELARCQDALGGGYLNAAPEELFDWLEAGKKVWAPYYGIHKIMAGMLDMYLYCDNRQALEVANSMASWVKKRTDKLTREHMQRILNTEFGGMEEIFCNLYAVTGNPDHLETAHRFHHKRIMAPLAEQRDELKGLHANTAIPKLIGAACMFELTGERYYHDLADFFWDQVISNRCYVTGGTCNFEHWDKEPHRLSEELGVRTHESCCTYNLLKLTRHLFAWKGRPHYIDYYERALFNGILPIQNPEDGMLMFDIPMKPGWWKMFSLPWHSFWCCTGTGIESFSKFGDTIYFHDNDGVFVNLFISSELDWREKNVRIRQDTAFPEEESTKLIIHTEKPVEFSLHIRVPYWVQNSGQVSLNGNKLEVFSSPSSYLTIKRMWKDGDRIEINLPMNLHLDRLSDDEHIAAIMYGPLVLAGELGTEGLTRNMMYGSPDPNIFHFNYYGRSIEVPYFVTVNNDPNTWVRSVKGKPLTFMTIGQTHNVQLIPFYKLFGQRYSIYWEIFRKGTKTYADFLARDTERKLQRLQSVNNEVQECSYKLKVTTDQPMTLLCTFWVSGIDYQVHHIYVENENIASGFIYRETTRKGEFPVPEKLTQGKSHVTVTFRIKTH